VEKAEIFRREMRRERAERKHTDVNHVDDEEDALD